MRKSDMDKKWEEKDIIKFLQESAREQQIPQSLLPKQMEERLKQQTAGQLEGEEDQKREVSEIKENAKKHKYFGWWCGTFATAACLALVLFVVGRNLDWEFGISGVGDTCVEQSDGAVSFTEEGTTYEKLYQTFDKVWAEQESLNFDQRKYAVSEDTDEEAGEVSESASADTDSGGDMTDSAADMGQSGENNTEDYGRTNQQEESVEEADIIKNDGRYLYQTIYQKNKGKYAVRIVDTQAGLTETARVGDFEEIQDIYVWKDKLIILEPGWAENLREPKEEQTEYLYEDDSGNGFIQILKNGIKEIFQASDTADMEDEVLGYAYCRIRIYDISDRSNPQEYHTFTIKGSYMDSRISDGYLYFFTSCDTSRPARAENLRTYVPMLDGTPMAEDKICLPEDTDAASYLVMASVNMEQPDSFTDTRALVASADKFYVSQNNIYVADSQYLSYGKKGINTDTTKIYRYSYKDGKMNKEAEGTVKGTLRDDMAMNEYQNYLRMVTTVEHHNGEEVVDDISGEVIGYDTADFQTSNSLYVLDQDLQVAGKIENLAKDERIYSARFMGDAGYFVTFRETDPLFSVDLSNPQKPEILGELKISGFSEYLHFYSKDLLLGIGMEADESTGETRGMKISMFDISNPADVKEQSKLNLAKYDDSDALYNYKAVLIDPEKNLFGFSTEGYGETYERAYFVFSYENGEFQQILKIDCSDDERWGGWSLRGTYIKDRFFLLAQHGRIEEYSLTDKSLTRELEP